MPCLNGNLLQAAARHIGQGNLAEAEHILRRILAARPDEPQSLYLMAVIRLMERRPADAEWNILCDPKGAAKLFASGVPIFMMPLDSTQIHLLEPERKALFAAGNPLATQLDLLYQEWSATAPGHPQTPTLFDPVAAAYTFRPELCPMTPMRIEVDAKGFTRKVDGAPNAQICLKSDEAAFLKLLLPRLEESGK